MSKKAIVNIAVAIIVIAFVFNTGDIGRYSFVAIISYIAVRLAIYSVRYFRRNRSNKGASRISPPLLARNATIAPMTSACSTHPFISRKKNNIVDNLSTKKSS